MRGELPLPSRVAVVAWIADDAPCTRYTPLSCSNTSATSPPIAASRGAGHGVGSDQPAPLAAFAISSTKHASGADHDTSAARPTATAATSDAEPDSTASWA